jgi:hypothetical protein
VIEERSGWPVQLEGADPDMRVEALHERAIAYFGQLPGPK